MGIFGKRQPQVDDRTVRQVFSVPAMHCTSCAVLLEGLEDEVSGINTVEASYLKQRMVVEYDAERVTLGQIIEAAKKAGYDAQPVDSSINLKNELL